MPVGLSAELLLIGVFCSLRCRLDCLVQRCWVVVGYGMWGGSFRFRVSVVVAFLGPVGVFFPFWFGLSLLGPNQFPPCG